MIHRDEVAQRLQLHDELAVAALTHFVRDAVTNAEAQGVVLGLSGGVDSALAVALAVGALEVGKVHAFYMPYRASSAESAADAAAVAERLKIPLRTIDISPQVDAYFDAQEPDADQVRRGNKMARERMAILFDLSKKLGCLVLGTSNKTEILLGYSTVFGDNASSLNPLGDLYKQQVWQLSRWLGLPEQVIAKKASADLWPGQTDEGDLGFDYRSADEILYLLFDQGLSADEVVERGYAAEVVDKITTLERRNRFKRRLMLIARLSGSAVNLDREIPARLTGAAGRQSPIRQMPGRLLVVSTPIGNLADLSPRARSAFAAADLIACEDTRHTGRLLHELGIKKPLVSLHDHNERQRLPRLLAALEAGQTIAVASDAGTPLLSDPGYLLVRGGRRHRRDDRGGARSLGGARCARGVGSAAVSVHLRRFPAAQVRQAAAVLPGTRGAAAHAHRLRVAAPPSAQPRRRPRRARRSAGGALARADQAARRDHPRIARRAGGGRPRSLQRRRRHQRRMRSGGRPEAGP